MQEEAPTADGGPLLPIGAYEDLFASHWLAMVRLALLLVDDDASAEDVVQDAYTGLHRHWHRLTDRDGAVAHLHRSVVNGSRSVLRRRRNVGTGGRRRRPSSKGSLIGFGSTPGPLRRRPCRLVHHGGLSEWR